MGVVETSVLLSILRRHINSAVPPFPEDFFCEILVLNLFVLSQVLSKMCPLWCLCTFFLYAPDAVGLKFTKLPFLLVNNLKIIIVGNTLQ